MYLKIAAFPVFCMMAAIAGAGEHSVKYDAASGTFDSEIAALSTASAGSGGKILSICGSDGDKVVISGDGIVVSGDLEIRLSAKVRLVMDVALSASGNLKVTSDKPGSISWTAPDGEVLSSSGYQLLFPGASLSDYEFYSSDYSNRGGFIDGLAKPAEQLRDNGNEQTAQFQRLTTQHTKVIAVKAVQTEDGIEVIKEYGKYIEGDKYGEDFDVLPGAIDYSSHYHMTQLTMRLKTGESIRSVRFSGPLSVGGDNITVDNGVYAVVEKVGALLDENGVFNKNVRVDFAAFFFEAPECSFTLCGNMSGSDSAVGFIPEAASSAPEPRECRYELMNGPLDYRNGFVKIMENASLADVVSIQAYGCGNTLYPLASYKDVLWDPVFEFSDGWRHSAEFQSFSTDHLKGMGIMLKQIGSDIYLSFQYAAYLYLPHVPEAGITSLGDWHFAVQNTHNCNGSNCSIGTKMADGSGYSISNLTVTTRRPVGSYRGIDIALSNNCDMTWTDFVLKGSDNARVRVKHTDKQLHPFPVKGNISVQYGALLDLAVTGLSYNSNGFQPVGHSQLEVCDGGAVNTLVDWQFSSQHKVKVSGGDLAFAMHKADGQRYNANWKDAGTYVGVIEYSNGGRSLGASPRMGQYMNPPKIVVRGDTPCRAEHGISVVVNGGKTLIFDVEDVTSDGASDFMMTGAVLPFGNDYKNFKIVKTGSGTLEFFGANDYTNHPTQVKEGVLKLGASGAMHGEMDLSLEGGSFAVAPETVNTLGELVVSADAGIAVSPGATLAFADSSRTPWADGVRVDIVKDKTSTVRFGESAGALTARQIAAIRVNGYPCRLDEDGRIAEYAGTVIIMR